MGLQVHVAASAGTLAEGLAGLLSVPPADPFARELVVVPAHGVERWLSQRLSHVLGAGPGGDGVTACVDFVSPWSLTTALAGREGAEDDPWHPERLTWALLACLDDLVQAAGREEAPPWALPLLQHLGAAPDRDAEPEPGHAPTGPDRSARRLPTARRLARLFASYATQRPALLSAWQHGEATDGLGSDLPEDLHWQPPLWRLLVQRHSGTGTTGTTVDHGADALDPVAWHEHRAAHLRAAPEAVELPDRFSVFGHTRLAAPELQLLEAAAQHREVHVWLPVGSPAGWRRLEPVVAAGPVRRRDDRSARALSHPLLRALGRDVRELQRGLSPLLPGATLTVHEPPPDREPEPHGAADSASLLAMLQHDLREDREPDEPTRTHRQLQPGDVRAASVSVHACHGLARQVEVLREALLGVFADDPTLEPRDVLVLCPDVDAVAPLFAAEFGLVDGRAAAEGGPAAHPARQLRVQLADRGLARTNPMLSLAAEVLELVDGRATLPEVLALLGSEPVRRRFRLDDDAVQRCTAWAVESGVRWGLDVDARSGFGLTGLAQNTWLAGLERLLLGGAMAEPDGPWADRVPLDDVGSADLDLAGRLAEAVGRLRTAVGHLESAHTLAQWTEAIAWTVEALGAPARGEEWQLHQLQDELEELNGTTRATAAGQATGRDQSTLTLPEVRQLLRERWAPRPTRSSFRTGAITVCSLVPMRSVPHRVVCLVGLDDGRYPRTPVPDGDDVLARDPVTGERDPRAEDRQLVLDAVMAAGEQLLVTYTGHDERSGASRPPSLPLGDLLDALDLTATAHDADGRHVPVSSLVTWHHPLQPVDPRHHRVGGLTPETGVHGPGGTGSPFSFDAAAAAGARAWVGDRRAPRRWSGVRLPPRDPAEQAAVSLAELQEFFTHPVRAFVRQRLDVAMPERVEDLPEAIPVDLDPLAAWKVGDRMLRGVLGGRPPARARRAEEVRGDLPPGRLGLGALQAVEEQAGEIFRATTELRQRAARSVDVDVELSGPAGGVRLTGVVPDVRGSQLVRIGYSRLGPGHRLSSWIDLLALTASDPDHGWTAVTVGSHRSGPTASRLPQVGHEAAELLADLVAVREEGLRQPLPIHPKLAWRWLEEKRLEGRTKLTARREWFGEFGSTIPGLAEDPAHHLVYGDASWRTVQGHASAEERWHPEDSTRLGQYAWRTWRPLLDLEREGPA
ncbi:exodeoxyribonuclease V subunit gamma [Nocardioidaceae bacterium]|nr:exodeoxyribonuclease V subunit gamma [Nocardioidaceae bacterium]